MKKKSSANDKLNLFFSAFLIIAYIVCGYFFVNFANSQTATVKALIVALVLAVFGLILFYATRVCDTGKVVFRFSAITLVLMDLPALYVVLASIFPQLPLYDVISVNQIIGYMAAVALGYGIPYTFISGFEMVVEDGQEEVDEEKISEIIEEEDTAESEESEETDEIVVEGTSIEEETEEYSDDEE